MALSLYFVTRCKITVDTNGQRTCHEVVRPPAKNGCRGQMTCKLHNKMKASCAPFPDVQANNNAGGTVVRWAGRWGLKFPSTRLIFSRNFQHALDATPLDLSRNFVRSSCYADVSSNFQHTLDATLLAFSSNFQHALAVAFLTFSTNLDHTLKF